MTHTTFTHSNLQVSSAIVGRLLSSMSKRKRASRVPRWTVTQCLHQNTELEATPSVKTCVSKILKESLGSRQEHQSRGNWKRLEHKAPGDRLLLRIRLTLVKGKFILNQTLMEQSTSGKSMILQEYQAEEHEFYSQNLDNICARLGRDPTNLQDSPLNVAIWSQPVHERLRIGFFLAKQRSRGVQSGDEQKLSKNTSLNTVRADTYNMKSCRTGTHFDGQELRC